MKQERVEFRTSDFERKQFEEAANLKGMSFAFLRNAALEISSEILKQHESILLSNKDRDAFLKALDHQPEPNKEMKKAYKEYKRLVNRYGNHTIHIAP